LKIVHVITKLELGGAQVNTIYTVEHLSPDRFDTYLICGPGGILTERVEKKEKLIIMKNMVRQICPYKDWRVFFQLKRKLRELKPDVVHTHSSKAGILGRLAAYFARVPVIIHSVHGFSFSPFQSAPVRTIYSTAERLVRKITRHFIFVAQEDIETAKKYKLVQDNFSLIRSGFPVRKFFPSNQSHAEVLELRSKYGIKETDFVCGIIAPFKPQKGLFHLIEIAAEVIRLLKEEGFKRDIIFMITGDGNLRPEIENKLSEKGISDNFRLPGFLFDIENAIEIFDLGISTALWEGLPQSLIQLRLKKKAIVASDISGNREVIKNGQNGFLADVFDYKLFAQKIRELVTDETLRKQMESYEEDFSQWDADYMVKRQEALYEELCGKEKEGKGTHK